MEVDRLSHHPCHRLSVPAAKLFWCRHCMEKFEDPISRWRHSKTCKTEGTLNMNKRKEQEAEAFKLFVESTTEAEQETEMESAPQPVTVITPVDKVTCLTQQTGTDLNCFICKKEFISLDEMRAHVRTPCNKQDKHVDVYGNFPFITESFVKDNHLESTNGLFVSNQFDSLLSMHSTDKSQSREDILINQLLSQWSQEKTSFKQSRNEVKYHPPLPRNSTVSSLQQTPNIQPMFVLDSVNGGVSISPIPGTCSQDMIEEHEQIDEVLTRSGSDAVLNDCAQDGDNTQNCSMLVNHCKVQEVINELSDNKRKRCHEMELGAKRQRVDVLLLNDGDECDRWASHKEDADGSVYMDNETKKAISLKNSADLDILKIRESNKIDNNVYITENNSSIVTNVSDCQLINTDRCDSHTNGASTSNNDQYQLDQSVSLAINLSIERSDKENHTTDDRSASKSEKPSSPLKCFRPVRTISSVVSPLLNYDYSSEQIRPVKKTEKEFTVLTSPETIIAGGKSLGNSSPITKSCSIRKYNPVKIGKNKPKPVRAVIPVVNTGIKSLSQDDSDNDSIDNEDSKYRHYPPSPAKTRSKYHDRTLPSVRSTARKFKPTLKKIELMVEKKSKLKVQQNPKKQSAIKDQITNKKAVKKSGKISEKQVVKKVSAGKEAKFSDKKTKLAEKQVIYHELKNEKSKSKPPKNLKCRLCDRVLDSVKQYQNHTRIPCKMKITRKWSQKVLRPKRSLPPSLNSRPMKKKIKDPKKPNLIPNSFRIHSQWEPSKRTRKPSKTKNRTVSPQVSIVVSSKEKRPLPHLQIDMSDLTEKEFFLYKFGLMCSDDLPLYLYLKPKVQSMSQPLAVSIENTISDNLSDCCNISPPILERIEIDDQTISTTVTDLSFNLEPPLLVPALQCDPVIQACAKRSECKMFTKCIAESVHDVSMNYMKNNISKNRSFIDMVSMPKNCALGKNDYHSPTFKKSMKTLNVSSQCNVLKSPCANQMSPKFSHSVGSNILLNTKPPCFGKEYYSNGKVADVEMVISPRRKEKRNLFESLGWEMLSKKADLSLSGSKSTSLPQRLTEQMDKDILGFLSKGLGIETSNGSNTAPVVHANEHYQQCFSSQNSQPNVIVPSPVVLQQQCSSEVLLRSSPVSPAAAQRSSLLSPQLATVDRFSRVFIPSPKHSTVTQQRNSTALSHSSSPSSCIAPRNDSDGSLSISPIKIANKELNNKPTQWCNQGVMSGYQSELTISNSTETNINHIVRKLQFNTYQELANTCNIPDTELVPMVTKQEGSLCGTLLTDNMSGHHAHVQEDRQCIQNIEILHEDEPDNGHIKEVLADMVQRICCDSVRQECSECSRKVQHSLHSGSDRSFPIPTNESYSGSDRSCPISTRESHLGSSDRSFPISTNESHLGSNRSVPISTRESHLGSSDRSFSISTNESQSGSDRSCPISTSESHLCSNRSVPISPSRESHITNSSKIGASEYNTNTQHSVDVFKPVKTNNKITASVDVSKRNVAHEPPEVTVEYVDCITSAMLDDSHDDVTYIIIEQDDVRKYIDSLKEISDDDINTTSCVSVS